MPRLHQVTPGCTLPWNLRYLSPVQPGRSRGDLVGSKIFTARADTFPPELVKINLQRAKEYDVLTEKDLERGRKFLDSSWTRQDQTCKQIKKVESALILSQAILAVVNKAFMVHWAEKPLDRALELGADKALIEEIKTQVKQKYNELHVTEYKADAAAAAKLWADNLEELKKKGLVTEPLKEGYYRARVYKGQNRTIEIKRCYMGGLRLEAWYKTTSRSSRVYKAFTIPSEYSQLETAQQEIKAIMHWEIKAA